jgi:GGDEF domain-containing protein
MRGASTLASRLLPRRSWASSKSPSVLRRSVGIDDAVSIPVAHGQAEAVAVDLHRAVAEAGVTTSGEVVASRVSIGIGAVNEQGSEDDAILAALDSSMSRAKRVARRVVTLQLERP